MIDLAALFKKTNLVEASDLHLRVGLKPRLRVHGELLAVDESGVVAPADVTRLVDEVLHSAQKETLATHGEIDCACSDESGTRYRVNFFRDYAGMAATFRRIPAQIQSLQELGIPEEVEALAHFRHGLVLVAGATGSGKSSTLAALLDVVNRHYMKHLVTLEDPIEFLHQGQRSMIQQRSIGSDVPDFATGVLDALRADADVLLVGELRDLETTRAALTAAETGMLVFATLHTNDAAQTIDRIVDLFPLAEQEVARAMLGESLAAVLAQTLLKRSDQQGRVPATELLIATPAIRALIREGRTHEIPNLLQGGREKGMYRLDDSIERLLREGLIDRAEATASARSKGRFERRPTPMPA